MNEGQTIGGWDAERDTETEDGEGLRAGYGMRDAAQGNDRKTLSPVA